MPFTTIGALSGFHPVMGPFYPLPDAFVCCKNLDRSFFHFVRDHACDRQTDGRTDGRTDRQNSHR